MGLRGPAKTPLEIVKRQGNPGHRPVNKRAPAPAKKKPTPSATVKADPDVLKKYRELVKLAAAMGVLTEADGRALEKLAQTERDWEEMVRMVRESGYLVQNPKTGMVHINPLMKRLDAAFTQLWRGYREFGFTPGARAGLHTEEAAGKAGVDEWSDF